MKAFAMQTLGLAAIWMLAHAWPPALGAMPLPQGQGSGGAVGPEPLALDRTFVQAMGRGGSAALELIADADFSWISAQGVSIGREDAVKAIASGKALKPVLGPADGQPAVTAYGEQMAVVQRHKDKTHSLHVWVRRTNGWKLLNIMEVIEYASVPYGGTTINASCTNPCSKVPFIAGNATQAAIMAAWQEQQTGPEGWLKRVAPENIGYSTNGTRSHASRVSVMNQQKASGASIPAPALLWARIWDFGDSALMVSIQQGNNAKAVWSTRVFHNRNGLWLMVEAYQVYMQDAVTMVNAPAR